MKFAIPEPQPISDDDLTLRVGNVYPSKNTRHTKYWIVFAIYKGTVHLIGINGDGEVTKTASYGSHVFDGSCSLFDRNHTLLGFCPNIENISLDILWR